MRVVIAEDSVLLREGLARLLADEGIEVVEAVGDGDELLAAAERHRPDLAIVDVRMPPTHTDEGLRAAIEARARVPEMAILVLSQYVEERYASDLLAAGGAGIGYLLKERVADVGEFVESVRRVAEGGTAFDPEVVAQLMGRRRQRRPALRADAARARGADADGRGAQQQRDRQAPLAHGRCGREAHQLDLRPARPASRATTRTAVSGPCSPTSRASAGREAGRRGFQPSPRLGRGERDVLAPAHAVPRDQVGRGVGRRSGGGEVVPDAGDVQDRARRS